MALAVSSTATTCGWFSPPAPVALAKTEFDLNDDDFAGLVLGGGYQPSRDSSRSPILRSVFIPISPLRLLPAACIAGGCQKGFMKWAFVIEMLH